jgi:hypothetical protein
MPNANGDLRPARTYRSHSQRFANGNKNAVGGISDRYFRPPCSEAGINCKIMTGSVLLVPVVHVYVTLSLRIVLRLLVTADVVLTRCFFPYS